MKSVSCSHPYRPWMSESQYNQTSDFADDDVQRILKTLFTTVSEPPTIKFPATVVSKQRAVKPPKRKRASNKSGKCTH